MRYGEVCAGISAASVAWGPLGWTAAWFAETEEFPCQVLAHHHPDVPNLGDVTAPDFCDRASLLGPVDVLMGGFPCQDVSLAGRRAGLAGDRSGLFFHVMKVAEALRPTWLVLENVPGLLSSGDDFDTVMQWLSDLRYIVDTDILDAQFFGLAQRRERVFWVCQSIQGLRAKKTPSSGLTIAQCICEISQLAFQGRRTRYDPERGNCESREAHARSLQQRIALFEMGDRGVWLNWLQHLVALNPESVSAPANSGFSDAEPASTPTSTAGECSSSSKSKEHPASGSREQSTSTEGLWKLLSEDLYDLVKSCITSTPTRPITDSEIFTCSRASLLIAGLILQSKSSSPCFCSAASSASTALEVFTSYAKQASSDLFTGKELVRAWRDFIREAERTCVSLRGAGEDADTGEVPTQPKGLSGHPEPRRAPRQSPPRVLPPRAAADRVGAGVGAGDGRDGSGRGGGAGLLPRGQLALGFGGDGSVAGPIGSTSASGGVRTTDLDVGGGFVAEQHAPIPFDPVQITCPDNRSQPGPGRECHTLAKDNAARAAVVVEWIVRRFTPREVERLFGLPDNFTLIPVGRRKACEPDFLAYLQRARPGLTVEQLERLAKDGNRYRALGNSIAVTVLREIAKSIQRVEATR